MSDARTEALARFPNPVDVHTGEPVDDWGYEEYAREAFIAGAKWQAERIAQAIEARRDNFCVVTDTPTTHPTARAYADAARIAREAT